MTIQETRADTVMKEPSDDIAIQATAGMERVVGTMGTAGMERVVGTKRTIGTKRIVGMKRTVGTTKTAGRMTMKMNPLPTGM